MATFPFEQLPERMKFRAAQVASGMTAVVRAAAEAIDKEVVEGTPVDTGKARSNWIASLDAPFEGEIPPYAPGAKLGINEKANSAAAREQAAAVITNFDSRKNGSIYITNNVGYVGDLNTPPGHSRQSGGFFVERAVEAGRAAIFNSKLLKE